MNSLISIIIPVYNVEEYLNDCLESVINQTYKNLEIIIINDKSTDNSMEIINKFAKKDSRIIVINNKKNLGYGKTINVGFKVAKGEFIGIVESDDFIAPYMYETLYKASKNTNAEIIKSNFYHYKSSKGLPSSILQSSNKELDKKLIPNKPLEKIFPKNANFLELNEYDKMLLLHLPPSIWSAIYRTDFIKKKFLKMLETKGAGYQDYQFLCETTFETNKIYLIIEKLYFYRVDNATSSINNKELPFILFDLFYKTYTSLKKRNSQQLVTFSQSLFYGFLSQFHWGFVRIPNNRRFVFLLEWQKALNFMIEKDFDTSWLKVREQKDIKYIVSNIYIAYLRLCMQYLFAPIRDKLSFKHSPEILYFIIFRTVKRLYKFFK